MRVLIHTQISEIQASDWNGLLRDRHPFLRHEFLQAMEQHGCVGEHFGWLPRHIAVYDEDELVGAMPLYEKHNSYGEFVFDHAWADAYQRAGRSYFPKLVSAVPYTPVTGARLLCRPEQQEGVLPLLLSAALQLTEESGASGFHCLFPCREQHRFLEHRQLLSRQDCQFHWRNEGYRDFDDFLARMSSKRRKNILRERRKVRDSGVTLRRLDGYTAGDREWQLFARFYDRIFQQKWGMATFNYPFFRQVAREMPDQVLLVLAELAGQTIAGALMYRSDTRLYGRHWGSLQRVDSLHFEACYYQGIEYCIEQGLKIFEPGAQGEHKIARGFLPTLTRSSHWLTDSRFGAAISEYLEQERAAVVDYMEQLRLTTPYKRDPQQ